MMYEAGGQKRLLLNVFFRPLTSDIGLLFSGRKGKGAGVICQFKKGAFGGVEKRVFQSDEKCFIRGLFISQCLKTILSVNLFLGLLE